MKNTLKVHDTVYTDIVILQTNGSPADPYMTNVYRAKTAKYGLVILKEMVKNVNNALGAKVIQRAEQEARTMQTVQDARLPRILDVEKTADRIWLIIEFAPGKTLAEHFSLNAQSPLTDSKRIMELLHIGIEVAKALKVYHQKKIAHRDVSPSNILVTKGGRMVKLIDIGLGALPRDYGWEVIALGSRVATDEGTPGYSAPEQSSRRSPLIGPNHLTDIFGLGAVLYHVLTGRTPRLPPPTVLTPVQSPKTLNPEIPESLEILIMKMLNRKRDARPPIGVVLDALRKIERELQTPTEKRNDNTDTAPDS